MHASWARSLQFCADKQYFRCVRSTETPLTLYRGETSGLWYTTQLQSAHEHQYVESARRAATLHGARMGGICLHRLRRHLS